MMREAIPGKLNLFLVALLCGLQAVQFFVVPFLLPKSSLWLLVLIPCVFSINPLWYLMHESFHEHLHPNRKVNHAVGRLLAVFFGGPYAVLRFGHLMHHRFNGAPIDRPDLYDPKKTSRAAAWIKYYAVLFGGLYIGEFLSALLFFTSPKLVSRAVGKMMDPNDPAESEIGALAQKVFTRPDVFAESRQEGIAAFALYAASLACHGSWWPVFAAIFLGRAFLVSFYNNIPHYGTSPRDVSYALNLRLGTASRLLYLNFFCHRVHHHDTTLPWNRLPAAMRDSGEVFDKPFGQAALAQLRGPISRAEL